ncbi:MAG: Uncharacterized protein G01um10147_515 [Microgenomates group bacterium Gr01-1014_7]|nr:MAG: Uncharacterized protein G01um10147_515 [Microgenomates group bacterium Gr01-1014_7]
MFEHRIKKLKNQLAEENLDAVLVSSVSNITYFTGYSNFSKDEREAYLIISKDFQYVITDGRYTEAVKKQISHFRVAERSLFKDLKIVRLGVEENSLTVSEHKFFKKYFKKIKKFNVSRSIKSGDEIKKIEDAAKLGDRAFEFVLKKIKEGISEKELAFEIELYIKKNGGDLSFPIIVAFGKNSSVPHHQTGETKLGPSTPFGRSGRGGQIILLDFGVKVDEYCSDMTRTVFFGKATEKQRKIYQTVLESQKRTVDFINESIKNGKQVQAKDVDKVARNYIISRGFPSIPHSLGHGVGLEIHEHPHLSPKSKEELKEGMVFSIEPGIYIPGFGSPRSTRVEAGGVRIEDLFVYQRQGLKQTTNSPKEIIEI